MVNVNKANIPAPVYNSLHTVNNRISSAAQGVINIAKKVISSVANFFKMLGTMIYDACSYVKAKIIRPRTAPKKPPAPSPAPANKKPPAPPKNLGACSICLEDMIKGPDIAWTKCMHKFHATCLNAAIKAKDICPECRTPRPRSVHP